MAKPSYYHAHPKAPPHPSVVESDICIYGATSGGITAAVQAARMGKRVVLVEFGRFIGGMSTSGLGATDTGKKYAIRGLAQQFYKDIGAHYSETKEWNFEPHVAHSVFKRWLEKQRIPLYLEQPLARVEKIGPRIIAMHTERATAFKASVFIDATYEGDLMAKAGVRYRVGREGDATYKELYNGVQYGHPHHNFLRFVDPYRKPGDPRSGLLQEITHLPAGVQGQGDHLVQAYNFRLCLTKDPKRKVPFPKPAEYDRERYELLRRYIEAGIFDIFFLTLPLPNKKADHNNWGGFNSDHIGANYDWPDGSYAKRERIYQDHVDYQQGLFWFLSHDPRLPRQVRDVTQSWGLAADEFVDSGNWPPQLYIREARRMISDYVVTEHDVFGRFEAEDSVGMASYNMDSHNCKRVVYAGRVINEGNVEISPFGPYPISYRAIRPKREECTNLLVPVCISASHIAFGSVRMEPVFMILGQSAGAAAALALSQGGIVQDVSYGTLEKVLRNEGQILKRQILVPEAALISPGRFYP